MRYTAIIFFLLGVITYFVFPRDWKVPDPPMPKQNTMVLLSNENGCAVYQFPYEVGKNLQIVEKVVCR